MLLLRPRDGVIEPAPVRRRIVLQRQPSSSGRATSAARQLALVRRRRLAIEAGAPRAGSSRARRARLRGPFRRPVLVAARAGAALSVGADGRPAAGARRSRRQRAIDVGLVDPVLGRVAGRRRQVARRIGAVFAGVGAARGDRRSCAASRATWWLPGASLVVGVGRPRCSTLGPVVLDPIFNRFTPLPAGRTRSDVLELARAGAASRSARSTRSTPAAARRPPTPTSPAWAAPSASCSTTPSSRTSRRDEVAPRRRPRARPRPLPRRPARAAVRRARDARRRCSRPPR